MSSAVEPSDPAATESPDDDDLLAVSPAAGRGGSPLIAVLVACLVGTAGYFAVAHISRVGRRAEDEPTGAGSVPTLDRRRGAGAGAPVALPRERIDSRLVVLLAVAARAQSEYFGRGAQEARDSIIGWVAGADAAQEVDAFEKAVLLRLPGTLDESVLAEASWQVEGAVVLAWGLGLLDGLPPFDEVTDPSAVGALLGFPDGSRTRAVLRSAGPCRHGMVEHEAERHHAIHRRLLAYSGGGGGELASGRGDSGALSPVRELAAASGIHVAGRPIVEADPEAVEVALGVTTMRLQALRWLQEGGPYRVASEP